MNIFNRSSPVNEITHHRNINGSLLIRKDKLLRCIDELWTPLPFCNDPIIPIRSATSPFSIKEQRCSAHFASAATGILVAFIPS
jgi:hypothetical protein